MGTFKNMHDRLSTEYAVNKILKEKSKDPIAGWSEYERKVIEYSNDPASRELRRKVQEYRLDQQIIRHKEKQLDDQKRVLADLHVRHEYSHVREESIKATIEEYSLEGPKARLAACKLLDAQGLANKPEPVNEDVPATDLEETPTDEE